MGSWGPISTTVFGSSVDERVQGANDADTTEQVVDRIANGDPDDVFVHLDEVDGAGHSSGSSSQAYLDALAVADAQIGEILDAVQQRAGFAPCCAPPSTRPDRASSSAGRIRRRRAGASTTRTCPRAVRPNSAAGRS